LISTEGGELLPFPAMLLHRLPGYASKLACGGLTRAAAALPWIEQSHNADAVQRGCAVYEQQLLQLRGFSVPLATWSLGHNAHKATSVAPAGSNPDHRHSLATIASPGAAGADIFDR
jgi:hypothetical protein